MEGADLNGLEQYNSDDKTRRVSSDQCSEPPS